METQHDRTDPNRPRIPPGQYVSEELPVLQAGPVQHVDPGEWSVTIDGLVGAAVTLGWEDLQDMPATEQVCDIHCVTRWSKLDTRWKGVRAVDLMSEMSVAAPARHVLIHAVDEWTTNLPLEEFFQPDVLFAYEYEGKPIPDEHGGPVRLVVPRLYFWKSAKWVSRVEFREELRLGYWESMGYHPLGDPWLEQRYSGAISL